MKAKNHQQKELELLTKEASGKLLVTVVEEQGKINGEGELDSKDICLDCGAETSSSFHVTKTTEQ